MHLLRPKGVLCLDIVRNAFACDTKCVCVAVAAHTTCAVAHMVHTNLYGEMDTRHDTEPFSLTVILCIAPYLMQLNAMPFGV